MHCSETHRDVPQHPFEAPVCLGENFSKVLFKYGPLSLLPHLPLTHGCSQSARGWAGQQGISSQVSSTGVQSSTGAEEEHQQKETHPGWRPSSQSRGSPRLSTDLLSPSRSFQPWASNPLTSASTALRLLLRPCRQRHSGCCRPATRLGSAARTQARSPEVKEVSPQEAFAPWPDSSRISTAVPGSPRPGQKTCSAWSAHRTPTLLSSPWQYRARPSRG